MTIVTSVIFTGKQKYILIIKPSLLLFLLRLIYWAQHGSPVAKILDLQKLLYHMGICSYPTSPASHPTPWLWPGKEVEDGQRLGILHPRGKPGRGSRLRALDHVAPGFVVTWRVTHQAEELLCFSSSVHIWLCNKKKNNLFKKIDYFWAQSNSLVGKVLDFHTPGFHMSTGSCPGCATSHPAPCLWPEKAKTAHTLGTLHPCGRPVRISYRQTSSDLLLCLSFPLYILLSKWII